MKQSGLSFCVFVPREFALDFFPNPMLDLSRTFSILHPLLPLHTVLSLLAALEKLVNQVVMGHRSMLRFLFCQFLLFSILSGFTNFCPYVWPYVIWSGSCLNLCQSPPEPHLSFRKFFFQWSELREAFLRI